MQTREGPWELDWRRALLVNEWTPRSLPFHFQFARVLIEHECTQAQTSLNWWNWIVMMTRSGAVCSLGVHSSTKRETPKTRGSGNTQTVTKKKRNSLWLWRMVTNCKEPASPSRFWWQGLVKWIFRSWPRECGWESLRKALWWLSELCVYVCVHASHLLKGTESVWTWHLGLVQLAR